MPTSTCFVIQPFDKGKFDERFNDVFKPAIEEAELEPYRVDQDPASSIPIDDIERGIRDARICLAEISTDNPNVWFELGFAISADKPVVLVCSSERATTFPFDVQHRNILRYSTESQSDFEDLRRKIVGRIKAALHKEQSLQRFSDSPVADVEGLSSHEVVVLAVIAENIPAPQGIVAVQVIKRDVDKAGFTKVAAAIALTLLGQKGFVTYDNFLDGSGQPYVAYSLTDKGWQWILRNQQRFQIQRPSEDDRLPF
jgi:hypothetical protein